MICKTYSEQGIREERKQNKMKNKVILVWFRNDLRFHDNRVLHEAIERKSIIIPVYCFDERYYKVNRYNNKNTGIKRAQFIRESVLELKERLQEIDSDLMVFKGLPEEIIPRLTAKYEVDEVYHHREIASRETNISDKVETAIWAQQINLKYFIGHTLYHKEDLPYSVLEIPDAFQTFKKELERESFLREPKPTLTNILTPHHLEKTEVPSLEELGFSQEEINDLNNKTIQGGELKAIQHLEKLCGSDGIAKKITEITPYIANGLLSPIYTYHTVRAALEKQNKTFLQSTLDFLLWRDYCRFMLKKYPNVFFQNSHVKNISSPPQDKLELWKKSQTGVEIVDEAITQMKKSGIIPYSLRKIAGRYLIEECDANWTEGASFFEEHLLDYEPSTNYSYWAHLAGEGTCKNRNKPSSWKKLAKAYLKENQKKTYT